MPEDNIIYFTTVALNKYQINEVIPKLREECQNILADWLEDHKELVYGEYAEQWKPFGGEKTLEDIICADSGCYESETHLISCLDKECTNILILDHVRVFFIDPFAIYIDKFKYFAERADLSFRNDAKNNCCFLINYELPLEGQKHLEEKFLKDWPSLSKIYIKGCLHRVSVRVDDVINFKNYLKRIIFEGQDIPDSDSNDAAEKSFGYGGREMPGFKRVK